MLTFFRKYQRGLVIAVAGAIIVSFVFFGTQSVVQELHQAPSIDRVIGQAVDGSEIHSVPLDMLQHLLTHDRWDAQLGGPERIVNFFDPGIFREEVLMTGLADLIGETYFEYLRGDLEMRHEKEKHYIPYRSPTSAGFSAELLWRQFCPQLMQHLTQVREIEISPALFAAKVKLYLDQNQFSPELLRRILNYHQSSLPQDQGDPYLMQRDLALFGYHTLEEWFGKRWLNLACQWIWNAAIVAQEEGIVITPQEVKAELLQVGTKALGHEASPHKLTHLWKETLIAFGVTEKQMLDLFGKAFLFKRLLEQKGTAVLIDRMPYADYQAFASEEVTLETYELPELFHLKQKEDYHALEKYLAAISLERAYGVPLTLKPIEEIAKDHPELVQREFEVELAQVTEDELAASVPLREMWQWQLSDQGWQRLIAQFTELKDKQDRSHALEGLASDKRKEVDLFSRRTIAAAHPEQVEEVLGLANKTATSLVLPLKGESPTLEGIRESERLISLLDAQDPGLATYTQDGKHYYRLTLIQSNPELKLRPFGETYRETQGGGETAVKSPFYAVVAAARMALKEGTDFPTFAPSFQLLKKRETVKRKDYCRWQGNLFEMQEGCISDLQELSQGNWGFFQLIEKRSRENPEEVVERMKQAQSLLASEAKRCFLHTLFERIQASMYAEGT